MIEYTCNFSHNRWKSLYYFWIHHRESIQYSALSAAYGHEGSSFRMGTEMVMKFSNTAPSFFRFWTIYRFKAWVIISWCVRVVRYNLQYAFLVFTFLFCFCSFVVVFVFLIFILVLGKSSFLCWCCTVFVSRFKYLSSSCLRSIRNVLRFHYANFTLFLYFLDLKPIRNVC